MQEHTTDRVARDVQQMREAMQRAKTPKARAAIAADIERHIAINGAK